MQLNDTVRITKPDGAEHLFDIKTVQDLAYYERFPIGGFTLDVLSKFNLTVSDNVCTACEG
jgi:hypothetical protein